ncbi:hypothetical protein Q8A67_020590 [Cirrhinus molitorella]|uniref:Uncharacterized protein n=1 Tax=Cirrhinus molitorella TaxID=172907 RepID=A0AA88PCV5_9TELE|nr:hypothetical protein Q8A67_020590 [Cirrhinus molitorella]
MKICKLTPAQPSRASLSPQRESSPVLFSRPDQHPSAHVSDMVSFGGSEDEALDDIMSLASSDAELSGSSHDPAPPSSKDSSAAALGMDAKLFRILSKAVGAGLGVVPSEANEERAP